MTAVVQTWVLEERSKFPQVISDRRHRRGFDGKSAAGMGCALWRPPSGGGFRIVSGVTYGCAASGAYLQHGVGLGWFPSMARRTRRRAGLVLEEVLSAKRRKNDRLPIFLFGDDTTAEDVPASVLHANALPAAFRGFRRVHGPCHRAGSA